MVIIYHYYFRFLNTHYFYNFKIPNVIGFGYLGVELFFIISGFVISPTLTKCRGFMEFIKKRFVRLIPAMVICSTITFLFVNLFDDYNLFSDSKSILNLVISNTFISPLLLNKFLSTNFSYIDGAYWSLWVEITFYVMCGLMYFFSPKKLIINFSILVFVGIVGFYLSTSSTGMRILTPYIGEKSYQIFRYFFKIFTFFEYGIWFLIGMVLKKLYYDKNNFVLLPYFIILFGVQSFIILNIYTLIFSCITLTLLLIFVYKPWLISFLGSKMISKVGVASYSIYLIHQNIGVLLINKLSFLFGSFSWMLGILILIFMIIFGIYSYKIIEMPFGQYIKTSLFKT